jgi:hypothetical protein
MENVGCYLPELSRVNVVVGHLHFWYFPMLRKSNGIDE